MIEEEFDDEAEGAVKLQRVDYHRVDDDDDDEVAEEEGAAVALGATLRVGGRRAPSPTTSWLRAARWPRAPTDQMSTPAAASRSTSTPPACSWRSRRPARRTAAPRPTARPTGGRTPEHRLRRQVRRADRGEAGDAEHAAPSRRSRRAPPRALPAPAAAAAARSRRRRRRRRHSRRRSSRWRPACPSTCSAPRRRSPQRWSSTDVPRGELGVATFQKVYAYVSPREWRAGERRARASSHSSPSKRISCRWCAAAARTHRTRTAARTAAQPAPRHA